MHSNHSPATFLLVDDDAVSILAMERALKRLNISNETIIARDGHQALDALIAAAEDAGGVLPPFIITLDMHMPRMDGSEFLERITDYPALNTAIVFIFHTQEHYRADCASNAHRVSGFLSKDDTQHTLERGLNLLNNHTELVAFGTREPVLTARSIS